MSDVVCEVLCRIIQEYGTKICEEPARVRGLLKDYCGEQKKEINALMMALEGRIPSALQSAPNGLPLPVLIAQSTRKLEEDTGLSESLAMWAVQTWVIALRVASWEEIEAISLSKKSPSSHFQEVKEDSSPVVSLPPAYSPDVSQPSEQLNSSPQKLPQVYNNPIDGAELVYIPPGEFIMGSNDDETEKPPRRMYLDGYWIYKHLVTVGQYKQFCREKNYPIPPAPAFNPNWSKEDHPIVNVSWLDTQTYCQWAGVFLPTEAQWEKAARGTDGRMFPWGNIFEPSKLHSSKERGGDAGGTCPVGRFMDSPYGLSDMAGNVWQWCRDRYDAKYYHNSPYRNPPGPSSGNYRVMRGGSWYSDDPFYFRTSSRYSYKPGDRYFSFGFRCLFRQDSP